MAKQQLAQQPKGCSDSWLQAISAKELMTVHILNAVTTLTSSFIAAASQVPYNILHEYATFAACNLRWHMPLITPHGEPVAGVATPATTPALLLGM